MKDLLLLACLVGCFQSLHETVSAFVTTSGERQNHEEIPASTVASEHVSQIWVMIVYYAFVSTLIKYFPIATLSPYTCLNTAFQLKN